MEGRDSYNFRACGMSCSWKPANLTYRPPQESALSKKAGTELLQVKVRSVRSQKEDSWSSSSPLYSRPPENSLRSKILET